MVNITLNDINCTQLGQDEENKRIFAGKKVSNPFGN